MADKLEDKMYRFLLIIFFFISSFSIFCSASPELYMSEAGILFGSIKEVTFSIEEPYENDKNYTGIGINRYSREGFLIESEFYLKQGFRKIQYIYENGIISEIKHISTEEDIITAPYHINFKYSNGNLVSIERFYYNEDTVDSRNEQFFLNGYSFFDAYQCFKMEFNYNDRNEIDFIYFYSKGMGSEYVNIDEV